LPGWAQPVAWVVMGLAFLLTMVTGIDYLWQAWKLRRDALRGHAG
jgi:CDP-diacylglycerol--glycerol-3-phosphate 3-phosphatidyltransferase